MTKEYAAKMWSDYLMNLRKPDKKERIMTNPAIRLAQDVEEGRYADTPEEVFAMIRDSVSQEKSFFYRDRVQATAYVLVINALKTLRFNKDSFQALVTLLAEITAQSFPET